MNTISASYAVSSYNFTQSITNQPGSSEAQTSALLQQQDTVSISQQGQFNSRSSINASKATEKVDTQLQNDSKEETSQGSNKQNIELNELELKKVQDLKKRDTEVKAHEQAHLAAAGQYAAGGASFSYETGPDGVKYAVSGEVPIDISKADTPEETILKMQTIKKAALAPASPSSTDRMIASQADAIAAQARQELMKEQNGQTQELLSNESENRNSKAAAGFYENIPSEQQNDGITRKTLMATAYQNIAALAQ